jgi:hypothetical protein
MTIGYIPSYNPNNDPRATAAITQNAQKNVASALDKKTIEQDQKEPEELHQEEHHIQGEDGFTPTAKELTPEEQLKNAARGGAQETKQKSKDLKTKQYEYVDMDDLQEEMQAQSEPAPAPENKRTAASQAAVAGEIAGASAKRRAEEHHQVGSDGQQDKIQEVEAAPTSSLGSIEDRVKKALSRTVDEIWGRVPEGIRKAAERIVLGKINNKKVPKDQSGIKMPPQDGPTSEMAEVIPHKQVVPFIIDPTIDRNYLSNDEIVKPITWSEGATP